jgi:hypothetical protein
MQTKHADKHAENTQMWTRRTNMHIKMKSHALAAPAFAFAAIAASGRTVAVKR